MLKTSRVDLHGKDEGRAVELTELPALVADRCARVALLAVGQPPDGGIVALAMQHTADVRKLGERGAALLQPFVDAITETGAALDMARHLSDWRNVTRLQEAALLLHVGFLIGRETVEIPVAMQIDAIKGGAADTRAVFCAPHISAVLHSKLATYRELETVLSTEDVFNLVELVNIEAIHAWRASQQAHKD